MNLLVRSSLLACLALVAGGARAQVQVSCSVPNTQVLLHEPIPVVVTLRNGSGEPMQASGDSAYALGFEVTDPDGIRIGMRRDAAPHVPSSIAPGAEVAFTNDLQALFRLDRPNPVAVSVRLESGGRTYATAKSFVDIQPGSEVASTRVPVDGGALRTVSLRVMNREQRDRLFLRLDDEAAGLCYGVIDLGRYIRVGAPVVEIDSQRRIHVLHLSGPNQFTHSVYALNGDRVSQRIVSGETSSVRLVPDAEAGFKITGEGASPTPGEPMVQPLPVRRGL